MESEAEVVCLCLLTPRTGTLSESPAGGADGGGGSGGSGSEPLSLSFTGAANEQSSLLRLLPPFSLSPPTSGRGANEL